MSSQNCSRFEYMCTQAKLNFTILKLSFLGANTWKDFPLPSRAPFFGEIHDLFKFQARDPEKNSRIPGSGSGTKPGFPIPNTYMTYILSTNNFYGKPE